MAFTRKFDNDLYQLIRVEEGPGMSSIPAGLVEFSEKIESYAEGDVVVDEPTEKVSIKHQLTFPPYLKVDTGLILTLNKIFKREDELANLMLATLNDRPLDPNDAVKHRDVMYRTAVTALLEEEVNMAIERSGNVTPALNGNVCPESVTLFEEFFEVSQYPNPRELEILAAAGDISTEEADQWCR
ncbi:hypothetical protein FGG08_007181 [Glutinoglossum americanum]|uniref:Uncharacterized protein n=1 Tax=Glutinoglossum americanum TaxID=1670608 RepID=A0A9P8KZM3_9PEZI|nr:hypothetical protein FGG08_007181 [Glutinoglossum americanum]